MRIGIVEPDGFDPQTRALLETLGPVACYDGGDWHAFAADREALFVRLRRRIDRSFLAPARQLRYLVSPTTGHTHIDEAELAARGVRLLSLRGERSFLAGVRATPEHIVGLTLALLRRYKDAFLHAGNPVWDRDRYRGQELCGSLVGLIGFGRIGSRLAAYLAAFGAETAFYDPDSAVQACCGAQRVDSLSELIASAAIVIVCASYRAGDAPPIGADLLAAMAGKYLINAARGELIDEEALIGLLEKGHFAGVALDVIADETGPDNRLARLLSLTATTNLIVTPHIGGATVQSMAATERFLAAKLAEAWRA
ncbi:NAD(P)-dependent oxidoreductase [Paenibacillus cymbidii]|uniref:NAD(P)-dependent oxidoreductase n=1 Tax=Paenibacillus cymbidii TaxID=1639034 RepID=UPI0014366DA7|nr:NAD(P)-dependent oxidoreductase [Paenibacillus cymbidii]